MAKRAHITDRNALEDTPVISGRRRFGAGLLAVVAGSGITAGAAASVADLVPANPDAELVSLCAQFDRLERHRQDATNAATTVEEDEAADLIWAEVREQQEPILARICSTPAESLEGLGAIAASLVLWDGELFVECDEPDACMNEKLKLALLRSVLAWRA